MKKIILGLIIIGLPVILAAQSNPPAPPSPGKMNADIKKQQEELQQQVDQLRKDLYEMRQELRQTIAREHIKGDLKMDAEGDERQWMLPAVPPVPSLPPLPDLSLIWDQTLEDLKNRDLLPSPPAMPEWNDAWSSSWDVLGNVDFHFEMPDDICLPAPPSCPLPPGLNLEDTDRIYDYYYQHAPQPQRSPKQGHELLEKLPFYHFFKS